MTDKANSVIGPLPAGLAADDPPREAGLDNLMAASSFGSAQARAIRAQTPEAARGHARRILDEVSPPDPQGGRTKLSSTMPALNAQLLGGLVHRLIFAVGIEGSTERTNLAKGELRRSLYELLEQALGAAGVAARHLEPFTDRGDSVLVLIKPHDDVPKTLLLGQLIPILAALLTEHNASVARPELRMRLRAVVHVGEIHEDDNGFFGDDLDVAFRLLDALALKKALKQAADASLILVVSEEIFHGIVQQGYLGGSSYEPLVRVRVGRRLRRGWTHIPPLSITSAFGRGPVPPEAGRAGRGLSGPAGSRPGWG